MHIAQRFFLRLLVVYLLPKKTGTKNN